MDDPTADFGTPNGLRPDFQLTDEQKKNLPNFVFPVEKEVPLVPHFFSHLLRDLNEVQLIEYDLYIAFSISPTPFLHFSLESW